MSDMEAADCVYHGSCCGNFQTGKQVKVHSSAELCQKHMISRKDNFH